MGMKLTPSMSLRSARGNGLTGPAPRETPTLGISSRQCEKLQRHCGKVKKL